MNQPDPSNVQRHTSHGGHGWMMIACCIPMLIVAVVLVATGVVSADFLLWAVGCTAMMVMMMRMMGGMGAKPPRRGDRDVEERPGPR